MDIDVQGASRIRRLVAAKPIRCWRVRMLIFSFFRRTWQVQRRRRYWKRADRMIRQ